mgnify:CR=1 FL=1
MFEKTELIQAITKGDIPSAVELYIQGERIPFSQHAFDYNQLYDTLVRHKAYQLIQLMAENTDIENDIYMLDKIDDSIFSALLRNRNPDDESIQFLKEFITSSKNINDEVNGETLLTFAIESIVDPSVIKTLIDAGCDVNFKNTAENNLINISIKKYGLEPKDLISYVEIR